MQLRRSRVLKQTRTNEREHQLNVLKYKSVLTRLKTLVHLSCFIRAGDVREEDKVQHLISRCVSSIYLSKVFLFYQTQLLSSKNPPPPPAPGSVRSIQSVCLFKDTRHVGF